MAGGPYRPPVLILPRGSVLQQAAQDLIGAAQPLGEYLASLPVCAERDRAMLGFDNALLWAHQVLARSCGESRIVTAQAHEVPQQ
ncbi:MAG TPA: hypothetical protein VFV90_07620 [Usitatibacter sp.]|nr:hypothetical protein [Usitatibacter sp.]